jgi:hypothetical protein
VIHDVNALLALLAPRGRMVVVGLPPDMPTINHFAVVQKNLVYSGSTIGTLHRMQEMLDFCGEKNITADVEASDLCDCCCGCGCFCAADSVRHAAATVAPTLAMLWLIFCCKFASAACSWLSHDALVLHHHLPLQLITAAAAACSPCQVINMEYVNTAMQRMEKGDVHFSFVIDINKSLAL